ncbi:TIGR03086 family metal-binding protein [Mycobacterium tuberculosis]|uniref:TIGR03086 family metal-binding protein n=1 Tax=Mycobacterium tuberculosis TaxID=1773 RepID=UPI002876FD86|nr:TIGR03086 family metal-binding protein [Mycobacterium tuberculosis]MDS0308085.1 TIGR03086 family metal-binding protein [Mycobacterium tuberculosis]MDS0352119.1 TIGR03086 family metal-binding protein [Mycobacterium tuberculosis]
MGGPRRPPAGRVDGDHHADPGRRRHRGPAGPRRADRAAGRPARQRVEQAWRRRGLAGTVELNSNQVPATVPVGILCLEFLVHAWDFAIATGSQVIASEPVSEYVLAVAGKVITPATRNSAGFAAPAAVGSFAPVLDRLIAFTGRQPTAGHVSAT